ncbi:MAG: hypothetical protein LBT89_00460 [Planctomycetaceae bacterium]|jgi:hypothetical protein|nr:hypothetical protein [Planctomycetaceae bacterium]
MDITTLSPVPAPFWFVQFFKVVGFTLHLIPMGVWFAGLPVAILAAVVHTKNSGLYSRRMFGQFPVMMALGINFGIVPLLFLQTTYYKAFYTATILTAWHWIAVIPILIVGYYSLYIAAYSAERRGRQILFGFIASLCLITIGLLISNGLTLMVRSDLWNALMEQTGYYGATLGTANNFSDTALWIRFATVFGFALITAGVWAVFDSHFLYKNSDKAAEDGYRRWTLGLLKMLSVLGLIVIASAGHLPMLCGIPSGEAVKIAFPHSLAVCLLLGPAAVFVLTLIAYFSKGGRGAVLLIALVHFLSLAYFAVVRQIGQNTGTAQFADVSQLPVAVQWDTLIAFLVSFVFGVLIIIWMLRQCALAAK